MLFILSSFLSQGGFVMGIWADRSQASLINRAEPKAIFHSGDFGVARCRDTVSRWRRARSAVT